MQYKLQESSVINYPADNQFSLRLNSVYPVNYIRFTLFDQLSYGSFTPILLVWSDLINDYIGSCCEKFIGVSDSSKVIKPLNGLTFYYANKMLIQGTYNFRIENLLGTIPSGFGGKLGILVEYFT